MSATTLRGSVVFRAAAIRHSTYPSRAEKSTLRSGAVCVPVSRSIAWTQALHPDLIITQMHCDVCAVTTGDVDRSGACGVQARQIALSAASVEQIFASIRLVARVLGIEERGEELVRRDTRGFRE